MARGKKEESDARGRGATRPKVADRSYVTGLVSEYCLVPDAPEKVARALVDMMCKLSVLTESGRGHIEIPGKPGATLDLPERSGKAMWQVICKWVAPGTAFDSIAHLVAGSGSTGSGATGSTRGRGGPRLEPSSKRNAKGPSTSSDKLRELEWDREQVIASMGAVVAEDATVVTDAVIASLRRSAEAERMSGRRGHNVPGKPSATVNQPKPHGRRPPATSIPPLPEKIKAIYALLCSLPHDEALNSPGVSGALAAKRVIITPENVRKLINQHCRKLKIRRNSAGYYIRPEDRP